MAFRVGQRLAPATRTSHTPRHTFCISIQQHGSRQISAKRLLMQGNVVKKRQCRYISYTPVRNAGSPLFQLGALSNSRENQWFSKASGLAQIEFSPQLQLIRSSEVLPQQTSKQQKHDKSIKPSRISEHVARTTASTAKTQSVVHVAGPQISDVEALALGRALISSHQESISNLESEVGEQKRLLADVLAQHAKERDAWAAEKRKFEKDHRAAAIGIVAAVAVTTLLALWNTIPAERASWNGPKNPFGPQISTAATRPQKPERSVKAVEAVESFTPSAGAPLSLATEAVTTPVTRTGSVRTMPAVNQPEAQPKRSWGGLFWS